MVWEPIGELFGTPARNCWAERKLWLLTILTLSVYAGLLPASGIPAGIAAGMRNALHLAAWGILVMTGRPAPVAWQTPAPIAVRPRTLTGGIVTGMAAAHRPADLTAKLAALDGYASRRNMPTPTLAPPRQQSGGLLFADDRNAGKVSLWRLWRLTRPAGRLQTPPAGPQK